MNDNSEKFQYFKSVSRIGFIFLSGLAVFFFASFLIVAVNTSSLGRFQIPPLVNKFYIDIHNDLAKNVKIKIDRVNVPDKPRGIILAQSIPGGKFVEKGKSSLTLTVNQAVTHLKVPELQNQTLEFARSALSNIPVGRYYYKLKLGTLTYMGDDEKNKGKNIILQQWPPPGSVVSVEQKVSLLVSGWPEDGQKKKTDVMPSLNGMHLPFAREYLVKFFPSLKLSVKPAIEPDKVSEENPVAVSHELLGGLVMDQSIKADTPVDPQKAALEVTVGLFAFEDTYDWAFERTMYETGSAGNYRFRLKGKNTDSVILEGEFGDDTTVPLYYARNGRATLVIERQDEIIDSIEIEPSTF